MNRRLIAASLAAVTLVVMSVVPAFASARRDGASLIAAGSSADQPLFSAAFPNYGHGVSVNYQALGSGTGQKDLNGGTVDFGCFDVPMLSTDGFSNFSKIVQWPVALFGVSIVYNLPNLNAKLYLTGTQLADIFDGHVTSWSNSELTHNNPGLKKLKGEKIAIVVRSDSSGTSYAYSDYLSKESKRFAKATNSPSKTPTWPKSAIPGSHSSGVAAAVQATHGSIGYVETTYYQLNKTSFSEAYVKNKAGKYLQPSLKAVAADAAAFKRPTSVHFSITNGKGKTAYPISTFSWCGMYKHHADNPGTSAGNAAASKALFQWEVKTGEGKYGPALTYPKLPKNVVTAALGSISQVS
ncbi:MAG TPA: phosphate ABC transporter substrate-binding protein PstS [Chloroflexota bacterium]|nr:phosphate ABC transporter substrate-binding protein PstS [Chloroflexota bacterium]